MKSYSLLVRLEDHYSTRPSNELLEQVSAAVRRNVSSVELKVERYAEELPTVTASDHDHAARTIRQEC